MITKEIITSTTVIIIIMNNDLKNKQKLKQ